MWRAEPLKKGEAAEKMAEKFLLEIVTPLGAVLSKDVEEVTAPGELGEFGVFKWHTHLITTLVPGRLSYRAEGKTGHMAVGAGFAEVLPEKTIILVDMAEDAEDINLEAAKEEFKSAEAAMNAAEEEAPEYKDLMESYERARVRVAAVEALRGAKH